MARVEVGILGNRKVPGVGVGFPSARYSAHNLNSISRNTIQY